MKSLQGIARIALATTTIGIVTSALVQAQDAPPRGNAANGRRLYLAAGCYTCHGRSGQGGNYNGPAPILAKMEIPFEGSGKRHAGLFRSAPVTPGRRRHLCLCRVAAGTAAGRGYSNA